MSSNSAGVFASIQFRTVGAFAAGEFSFGWNEFASEGFREDGLRQLINLRPGYAITRLNLVRSFEQRLNAPDYLLLF